MKHGSKSRLYGLQREIVHTYKLILLNFGEDAFGIIGGLANAP